MAGRANGLSGSGEGELPFRRGWLNVLYALLAATVVLIVGGVAWLLWWHSILLGLTNLNLSVVEYKGSGSTIVRISGFCPHSAYAIKKVETKTEGSTMIVFVYAFIARGGTTGRLEYDVTVPPSVKEIRFGKGRDLIWSRESSSWKE
jgi:hypothetical protein